ncbi:(Fe-S)-binding protein [Neolewinella lacunae]|uniref:(Fe-S)-binding protein n=1 Tax=Neolewinella lacunae TaxID=1517758 RepID=A0A923PG03_9BACT|nr:(Fe-S)-binding protein [Neolewinella lacunae]MBC6993443.1 (Fe-S)-binding protein [Neolewinella lacunae]MDN3636281.1 (Fe-S)-binding protein [Neolewinella lacunae]
MVQSIIFSLVAFVALGSAFLRFRRVYSNIQLGKAEPVEGPVAERWKNMLLVAFGQKKMFNRMVPAVLHFVLYAAFVFTQIELIEIFIDGVFGVHRFFATRLGGFYNFVIGTIEVLSLLAFVATVIFLVRRNLLFIPRFHKAEMTRWPKLDANLILIFEVVLLLCIFTMNGTDEVLQSIAPAYYPETNLAVSAWLGPAIFGGLGEGPLRVLERIGWWGHIAMVFVFLNYLPISKHLHILLAFPNTWFARLRPKGELGNMPEIMYEVKSMMGIEDPAAPPPNPNAELPAFGANDVFDMSRVELLGAFSCTECGRCTAVCPANITGKALSPRKIVMDVRDRAEEVGEKLRSGNPEFAKDQQQPLSATNFDDGRSLWDFITREEIHACTTCNACVEACPVLINPLEMIMQLRRHEILTEAAGPQDWLPLFNSIENQQRAWSVGTSRTAWAE